MPHFLKNQAAFDALVEQSRALIEAARLISFDETIPDPRLDEASQPVLYEAEALGLAIQSLVKATSLHEEAVFIALGASVAIIQAQCSTPHAVLQKRFRDQQRASYDEVMSSSKPMERMQ